MIKFLVSNNYQSGNSIVGQLHNSLRFQFSLGLGIYAGIYLSQNYDVPRVDEPSKLVEKLKEYLDEHKKK